MKLLGNLSPQQFLNEYWQKKPLLIRQAIPGFSSPLSPEELAGLACEEEVESRLIIEKDGPSPWHLECGPFPESRFSQLPLSHWTLLVQKANQYLPELAEFLDCFNFIPTWRIDDIMISYAPPQGSVGPHVDQYDVFLLQGLGQRRWQINTADTRHVPLLENTPLKILSQFSPEQEWILEPGDMLYLPPDVAHYGVALEDCITYSIGFRAPSQGELLTAWIDDCAPRLTDTQRYADPDLMVPANPGEIDARALEKVRHLLRRLLEDDDAIDHWFGRMITEPPPLQVDQTAETFLTSDKFLTEFNRTGILYKNQFSRFAFIRFGDHIGIYIDGVEIKVSLSLHDLAARLCNQRIITLDECAPFISDQQAQALLTRIYNLGALWFSDEDEADDEF